MTQVQDSTTYHPLVDSSMDIKKANYMINHIFLPPKLPQKDDFTSGLSRALGDMVLKSIQEFADIQGSNHAVHSVLSMLSNFQTVHNESGHIHEVRLKETLAELCKDGTLWILNAICIQDKIEPKQKQN